VQPNQPLKNAVALSNGNCTLSKAIDFIPNLCYQLVDSSHVPEINQSASSHVIQRVRNVKCAGPIRSLAHAKHLV
jgi:hypothetical protein